MSKLIKTSIGLLLGITATCLAQVTITEYPAIPDGELANVVGGPDGNLWFSEADRNNIGRMTTAGAVTEFPIPSSGIYGPTGSQAGIAAGPDGNVWFVEYFSNKIGRIDVTTGVITEFVIPSNGTFPPDIVAGPDGNLWFTESVSNAIGKLNPATGTITEFPVPASGPYYGGVGPSSIAKGPDGNLWFTGPSGDVIGKVDPSTGMMSIFSVSGGSYPYAITAGSDGNMWFTENSGNRIGRITSAGLITEFPVPTSASEPVGITSGSDGNLWFTEMHGNKVAKITVAGAITEYPMPNPGSFPGWITLGPDGNLWLTEEQSVRKIAKVSPSTAVSPSAPVWIGLKNSDDQGTQFDLRAEISRNGTMVASGESRCVTGVTRNADLAKEVSISLSGDLTIFNSGDSLALKILTRIGTNPDNSKCSGPGGSHSNSVGLRLYYDSTNRASGMTAAIGSNPSTDYFLHSVGTNFFIDTLAPITTTAKTKDSTSVNFAGGNPWKEIGTWSRTIP